MQSRRAVAGLRLSARESIAANGQARRDLRRDLRKDRLHRCRPSSASRTQAAGGGDAGGVLKTAVGGQLRLAGWRPRRRAAWRTATARPIFAAQHEEAVAGRRSEGLRARSLSFALRVGIEARSWRPSGQPADRPSSTAGGRSGGRGNEGAGHRGTTSLGRARSIVSRDHADGIVRRRRNASRVRRSSALSERRTCDAPPPPLRASRNQRSLAFAGSRRAVGIADPTGHRFPPVQRRRDRRRDAPARRRSLGHAGFQQRGRGIGIARQHANRGATHARRSDDAGRPPAGIPDRLQVRAASTARVSGTDVEAERIDRRVLRQGAAVRNAPS
jgi:hypothetical protein